MSGKSKPAIQSLSGKGLKLDLDVYKKLKAFQSGGEFWEHQSQTVIREHIGDFLPVMNIEESGSEVLCQMFVGGKEVASQSRPAKGVPSKERSRLESAIKGLKQKADSPHIDSTTKKIINEFKLPDPLKDSELYRTYGSRWNPKLMVIWGCEKERGSSVIPEEAPRRVAKETIGASTFRRLPWLLLLLLLLLVGFWAISKYEIAKKNDQVVQNNLPPAVDAKGNPVVDENGKPVPGRVDGRPIAVDKDGKPITDPNGRPLPADENGNPVAVNPENEVVLNSDGEPLTPRADLYPVATDPEGKPITGPDGAPLPGDENGPLAVDSDGEVVMGPDGEPLPGRVDNHPIATDDKGQPVCDPSGKPLPGDAEGNPLAVDKNDKIVKDEEGSPIPARADCRPIGEDDGKPLMVGPGGEPLPAERTKEATQEVIVIDGPLDKNEIPAAGPIVGSAPRAAATDEVNLAKITRPAVVTIAVGDAKGDYMGQGSGFLITNDGLVVTNHHVIEDGSQYVALLADGSPHQVIKVLASDAARDLALLRIDTGGRNLPYLALAPESHLIDVGEKIAVMGSPHGLEGTFTTGIVSAKRKDNDVDILQITAPVSPGSSGSPVVDTEATVVGIVTGGIVENMAQSLNFAVSVSELYELLKKGGAEAQQSIAQSGEEGAINRQSPEKIDDSQAIGKRPEGGAKEVNWQKDPVYQGGDIQPSKPNKDSENDPVSHDSQIAIKEVSREQLESGRIKLVLAAKLQNPSKGLFDAKDLDATLNGKEVEVNGSHIILIAEEGSHQLKLNCKDPETGKIRQLEANIDVTVKSTINIDVKKD